jgi:hypothetical protein
MHGQAQSVGPYAGGAIKIPGVRSCGSECLSTPLVYQQAYRAVALKITTLLHIW